MTIAIVTLLAIASLCHGAPQGASLDDLIKDTFGTGNANKPQPSNQQAQGSNSPSDMQDVDSLIRQVFGTGANGTTTAGTTGGGTILGTGNTMAPKDENCICVPYYQCQQGSILDDGVGLIDIRSGFADNDRNAPSGGRTCANYLDVCCNPPNVKSDEKVTPPPVQRKGCGQRHADGVGFRITGHTNEAQFGEFPWMVAILKEENIDASTKLNVYQCGGALIHRKAVLTAAHCVNGKMPSQLKVRAGEWDTQTKTEVYPHQDRNVEKVIVHDKFSSGSLRNDFAILILTEPVDFAENVDIVCLPEQDVIFDHNRCFASGWGKDVFGKDGHYQVILKKVDMPVVPHASCQTTLRRTRLGQFFNLDKSFICAGGEVGKDTCRGDGGSPLVCPLKNDPNRYAQAGIVAWGIGCGEDQIPGVYANVAFARRWIDEQMIFHNLDINGYQYNS